MKEITKYACPYCNAVYDKEYEAKQCAEECVNVEDPVQYTCLNVICVANNINVKRMR